MILAAFFFIVVMGAHIRHRPSGNTEIILRPRSGQGHCLTDDMYDRPEDFEVAERVTAVATRRGLPPARIALAWLLAQPGVTAPIIGATKIRHLEDAVAALEVRLSDGERKDLEQPYRPHRVLGHD